MGFAWESLIIESNKTNDKPYSRTGADNLPLDAWWQISQAVTTRKELLALSRTSKTMWALLAYRRAHMEAEYYLDSVQKHTSQLSARHPTQTCVEIALRSGQTLGVLKDMIRGCYDVTPYYLEGPEPELCTLPALFVAAEMGRIDVMKVLLGHGCDVSIRYTTGGDCWELGHLECDNPEGSCRNALCVAREAKRRDAVAFLLEQGIEDRCSRRCAWRHPETMFP
ncbi:hypothetical protein M426DRAFT_321333 [Hypoxylon sp. CI-4A]|nr:hypothetical protein M426DRAFT_321333 [Hypoxylon sp. CI-4A]